MRGFFRRVAAAAAALAFGAAHVARAAAVKAGDVPATAVAHAVHRAPDFHGIQNARPRRVGHSVAQDKRDAEKRRNHLRAVK